MHTIGFLNGFRFILALWVVLAHFYTLIGGRLFYQFPKPIAKVLENPITAVLGFILVTGFLMTYNYVLRQRDEPFELNATWQKFWTRRFFRLYPVYLVSLLAAYFSFEYLAQLNAENLIYFTGTDVTFFGFVRPRIQPSLLDLGAHLLLIHGMIPAFHDTILGVTWSLSLEMQFYAIFPFLMLYLFKNENLVRRRGVIFLVISIVISMICLKIMNPLLTHMSSPVFRLPSFLGHLLPLFLLGMVVAMVKLQIISTGFLTIALALILPFQELGTNVIIIIFTVFMFTDDMEHLMPAFIPRALNYIKSLLSGNIAKVGADLSYSLYLVHTLIIPIVLKNVAALGFAKTSTALISLPLTLIVCLIVCYLLFVLLEKPFIAFGKKVVKNTSRPSKINTL